MADKKKQAGLVDSTNWSEKAKAGLAKFDKDNAQFSERTSGSVMGVPAQGIFADPYNTANRREQPFGSAEVTNNEKAKFFELYNDSPEKANKYAQRLNRYYQGGESEDIQAWAGKTPETRLIANAASLAMMPLQTVAGVTETASNIIKPNDPYKETNLNSFLNPGALSSNLRAGARYEGEVLGTLDDIVYTTAQSLIAQGMTGGMGSLLLSGNVLESSYRENRNAGMSSEQAMVTSAVMAGISYITEHMGTDQVFDRMSRLAPLNAGTKTVVASTVKQLLSAFLSEGIEEGAEGLLDNAAEVILDRLYGTDYSTFATKKAELIAKGMSDDEATKQAIYSIAQEIGKEMLMGGASGLLGGGAVSVASNIRRNAINNKMYNQAVENNRLGGDSGLISTLRNSTDADVSAMAQNLNENSKKRDIGKAINVQMGAIERDAIATSLSNRGMETQQAQNLAEAIRADNAHEILTNEQRELLKQNKDVVKSINNDIEREAPWVQRMYATQGAFYEGFDSKTNDTVTETVTETKAEEKPSTHILTKDELNFKKAFGLSLGANEAMPDIKSEQEVTPDELIASYAKSNDMDVKALTAGYETARGQIPNLSANRYANSLDLAYEYGRMRESLEKLTKALPIPVDENVSKRYEQGLQDSIKARSEAVVKATIRKQGYTFLNDGNARFATNEDITAAKLNYAETITDKELTDKQRAIINFWTQFYKGTKYRLLFYATELQNGSQAGVFTHINGQPVVMLDVNEPMLLRKGVHEFVHALRNDNPALYEELKQYIKDKFYQDKDILKEAREQKAREDYANAQAQVRQGKIKTIAEYKSNLDPDSAEEEIIARHCENVFDDIEAVSEIYQRKPGLWNAIKEFFDKFLTKLKEVIAGYGRNDNKYAEELAQDIDAVERVRSILLKGREMAINNETQQEIVENSIPVDVSTDTVQGEDTKVANMSVADEMEDLTEIDMLAPYSVEWDRGILMDGEDTPTMYSTRAGIEALGFGYDITEDNGLKMLSIKTADGKLVDKDTPVSTIRSIISRQDSPLNRLIDMSKSKGIIGEDEQNAFYNATAEFIHSALVYGQDPVSGKDKLDAIWKWVGSDVFRAIKPNSDKQYGTSNDMQTVCKKTEQVLDSISEYQVKAKRGVSPGEVMRIYLETGKNGYQTPCPFCYVFSHWIRMGLLYETAASAEDHYMAKLKEKNGINDLEWWKKEYARQKEFADKNSKAIADAKADLEDIERMIDQFARPLADAVRNNDTEAVNRIQAIVDRLNTRYIAAYKLASASDYAGWIKNCILNIPRSGLKDATVYGDYKLVNRDILFDFRRADELVRDYPALARFRTSKGSAGGKAVENYADNKFGEVIAGIATDGERDADNKLLNYFNGSGTKEEFERQFDSARKRMAKQNLRGGQRFFSWSDNRIDTGIDMLFNFIQFSALGSAVQSYTKQIEGLELIASVGGYCNGSLVGKGIGFKNAKYDENGKVISGELVFSNIQGINAETTFELNRRYDKAGNILVGMNDTHIALALGDDRIFFVIPWHRSGLSNDLLFRMMAMLGEEYVSEGKGSDSDATDYSNYQEEKSYSKHMDGTLEKYKGIPTTVTDLFKKIEGMSAQGQTARDIRGFDRVTVENGKLSDSQIAYRKLRAKLMQGKSLTEEEKQWVIGDEYLTRLQDSMRRNEIESWGTDDIDSIYPYEYWDTNTTYANADRNGIRYLEYCRRLGVQPKFCGINNTGDVKGVADFTELPGYWKVLVDRRMYDTKGRYQGLTPISLVNKGSTQRGFLNELITPEGIKAREEEYAKMGLDYKVTRLADAVGARKIADRVRTSMGDLYNIDRASDGETALAEYKAAVEDVDLNKVAPQSKFSTRDLSYNTLVSKPNMPIVQIKGNVPTTRDDVVSQAKENAKRIGKVDSRGSVSVYISDINSDVILSSKGLRHGLDRRFSELAPVVLNAGEILKNSILINELYSRDPANIDYGMVLIGVAQGNPNDGLRLVESVVNRYTHDLVSMDVLYSINAKKNSTAVLNAPRGTTPSYRTDISIAELLELVNTYFPDVLPMDVLNHFGRTARPQGELGKSAKFSTRDYFDTEETNALTEDSKAGPLVNTLINTIKGAGATFSPKAFYDFYTENPEYDFVVRIQEGDGNAAFELADILAKMDSVQMVDDLKWYAVESHPLYRDLHTGKDIRNSNGDIATFAQTHRKGIREFRRLCDERIEQLKSETAHGENLGIKNMTDMPMNEVKDLFDRLNSNADIQKLADKVFGVAKDLNLAVVFSNGAFSGTNRVGYYHGNRSLTTGRNGLVALKTSLFNDRGTTNQQKATVILHEMIHAVTSSLLYTPTLRRSHFDVSVKTQNAIDAINGLYRRLIRSTATSNFKSTYGLTNVHEFVAELANPQFRDDLANAQVGDINPYVESLRDVGDLVGLDGSANLRDNTLTVLDNFIDNFYEDIDTYREMSAKRMYKGNSNVPKYSIRYNDDGSVTVDGISAFSGGGTIDYMLGDIVSHIFAAEYDEQIAAVYEANNGIKAHRDILDDKTLEELKNIKESIEYAHFSPVCTNVSLANNKRKETARDIEFAHKVAEWIDAKKPLALTVENVPQYANTQSAKIIIEALKRNGYNFKQGIYNSVDFGGDMSRDRFFIRALLHGEVPEVVKTGRTTTGWFNAVKDLIPSLKQSETSKQAMNKGAKYTKNYIPDWMKERLDATKINYKNPAKPLFVMGTGDANGLVRVYEADKPIGSVKAKVGEPKIILTNGRVLDVSPAVIARLMGIPDSFELPKAKTRAFKILGNGVPGQLSRAMAVPLINEVIEQDRANQKYSTRDVTYEEVTKAREAFQKANDEYSALDEEFRSKSQEVIDRNKDNLYAAIPDIKRIQDEYEERLNKARAKYERTKKKYDKLDEAYWTQKTNAEKAKEKAEIEKSGLSEADYHRKLAKKEFGLTGNFKIAGYLMPNGGMLNFGGGSYELRGEDHRGISSIYPDIDGSAGMLKFMGEGNIRLMPESPGVDMSADTEPTKQQYTILKRMIENLGTKEKYFSVDFTDTKSEYGYTVANLVYEDNINPTRVINDIKHYYATGEVKGQSVVSQFHTMYSLRTFEDGVRFVDVQANQKDFDGLSIEEQRTVATKIIRQKFMGRVIGIDNRAFVNSNTIHEYRHPVKRLPDDVMEAKLRAASELDNLLDAGSNFRTEPDGKDGHTHSLAVGDFRYFDTIFKVGNEYYKGVINIMPIARGLLLKDITKIENITQDINDSYGKEPKTTFLRDVSMNRISQNSTEVNPQAQKNLDQTEPNAVEDIKHFSVRTAPAPKKTVPVYKLMRYENGNLYPLYIDNSVPVDIGVWYDADSPKMADLEKLKPGFAYKIDSNGNAVESKPIKGEGSKASGLPNKNVIKATTQEGARWIAVTNYKNGGKAYYNVGLNGTDSPALFAMRPGWHAGSLPSMQQIGKGPKKNLRDDTHIWVIGEMSADKDYQAEADSIPTKDIPSHIPTDGYYMKATNPNAKAAQSDRIGWYIGGAFKVNRIISDAEARSVIDNWNAEHPNQKVDYDFQRESGRVFDGEKLVDAKYSTREYSGTAHLTEERVDEYLERYAIESNPHKSKAWIALMDPGDFMYATSSYSDMFRIPKETEEFDLDRLKSESQPIFLDVEVDSDGMPTKITGHEGRHRTLAMSRVGVYRSPVILVAKEYAVDRPGFSSAWLTGQSRDSKQMFVRDAIPLDYAHRDEIIEKFSKLSSTERLMSKYEKDYDVVQYSTRTELSNYEILAETLETNLQSQADKDALKMYKASYNEALKIRARLDELNALLREETHPAVQHNYQTQINELRKSLRNREEILDKVLTKPRIASLVAKQKADIQKLEGYLMDEQMTHQEDVEALRKRLGKLGDKIVQQNERFRAYRARVAENKGINYYRPRIEKVAKSLSEQLNTTLPIPFRQPIAGVLSLLDFTTKKDGNIKGGKANFDRQVAQAQFAKMAQDASDPYKFFSEYGIDISPDFADWVREIQQWFADATSGMTTMDVRAMDSYQLQSLYRFLKNIDTQAKKATKMYQAKATSVKELGENTMIHLEPLAVKEQGKLQGVSDFFTWTNAQPVTAFDRFGESGKKLFEAFADSQDQLAWDNKAIRDFCEELFKGKDITGWRENTKTVQIGDEKVTAPIAFWMEMYCYLNQEDSYRHLIEGGGFRMKDYKEKGKTITDTDRFMTEEDLIAIEEALTPEQKETALAMKKYMAETGSEWGNAVSRVRFGIDQFGAIKDYYPIKTIRSETQEAKMKEEDGGNLYALMNKSWTKGRVMNAKNALVVGDIFETFAKHMGEMATYHSFALSTLDTIKWLNYKSNELSEDDKIREKSVQGAMKQAYGNAAPKYIFDFLDSVNGTAQAKDDTPAMRLVGAKNRIAVGANFRVAVQQPLSLARAFSEINPKYFVSGFNFKQTYDEMMRYAGIAEWKANGHYETNISRSLLEQIAPDAKTKREQKITDITMKGAEWGDRIAWVTMWNAVKNEVTEQNPNLKGEELMKKVNERFRDIIYRTQVVDSTLTRSAYMRKKDYFHRITSSFKSEPTATLNMLIRAMDAFRYDSRRYGKQNAWMRNKKLIGTTLMAFAVTQILNAAVTAIIDAFRDDDDYETWLEKWIAAFKGNAFDNFMVLNSVPYVADIFSLLQGYTPGRPDLEIVSSLLSTSKQLWSSIQKGSMSPKTIFNVVNAAAYGFGIPLQNAMRDVIGFYNGTIGILYDLKITDSTSAKFQMSPETNKSGYTAFYSALKDNRTERALSLLTEMADNDLDAKKIYNGTYNLVKEDYQAGRISKEDAIKYVRMIVEFTGIERTDKQINDLVDGW